MLLHCSAVLLCDSAVLLSLAKAIILINSLNPLTYVSQQLTLELSDEVYADLQQKANAVGLSITEWIVAVVSHQSNGVSQLLHSTAQQEEARQRFRNHAGAISLGYATDTDNQSIDADLARAYASEYEG